MTTLVDKICVILTEDVCKCEIDMEVLATIWERWQSREGIREAVLEQLAANFASLVKAQRTWHTASCDLVRKLLAHDHLVMGSPHSEMAVLDALIDWLGAQSRPPNPADTAELLQLVRFPALFGDNGMDASLEQTLPKAVRELEAPGEACIDWIKLQLGALLEVRAERATHASPPHLMQP